jgi:hypothetical protein
MPPDKTVARELVDRFSPLVAEMAAGEEKTATQDIRRALLEAGAPRPVVEALDRIPLRTSPDRWVALGVLAAAVRARHTESGVFMDAPSFAAMAEEVGLPRNAARFLYAQASAHLLRSLPSAPATRSPAATYLALHRFGITNRTELLRRPDDALGQAIGMSRGAAGAIRNSTIRNTGAITPFDFLQLDVKPGRPACCPPLSDPRWADRFDFFGQNSRLAAIVGSLRQNIQDRIRAAFSAHITSPVIDAARRFGVGSVSLYNTAAAGAPFHASGEAIQTIEDLRNKATRQDAEAWLSNIRRQLEQVRASLRVTDIESYIQTSGEDDWGTGGGDGAFVRLEIRGSFGDVNVAPTATGGGFPIDSSNYNDGALAFEFFGTAQAFYTPIPFGDGTIPALDITGFRLSYTAFNDWFFDSAQLFFRYAVNGHSAVLTNGQPSDANMMRDDDLVHDDQAPGWVTFGDEFPFGIVPGSRLATARRLFGVLTAALNTIQASLTSADLHNVYVVRGDEIVTALRQAAAFTRNGEHELARAEYEAVLDILSVLPRNSLTALDRELLFAVNVLIAASYIASNVLPHAYARLVDAADYTVDDAESLVYLWHALADLFTRWGDQIYAAAGRDYEARLQALDRYEKVTAAAMTLTYEDGREDEVLDAWLDLSVTGNAVPANRAAWVADLRVRLVSYSGSTPVYGDPLAILSHETVPATADRGQFIRMRLDVSETRPRRGDLDFVVSNRTVNVNAWEPSDARLQARLASYNPVATPNGLRGSRQDIFVASMKLEAPTRASGLVTWSADFAAILGFGFVARVPAPRTCAARLQQRIAQLRIDQIHAHLNVYGVHDEYVPNGRFIALQRLASALTDRAVYFWSRYIDFLGRAEAAAIEEMDAAAVVELSDANVSLARQRVAQADLEVDTAIATVAATGAALGQASQTLTTYQDSYQIGLLRVMNSISLSYPPAVSMNLGGFVGSVSGADGYDQTFRTHEMQYQAARDQARASAEAAEFHRRLSELERLIAGESLTIEEIRRANAVDRLEFLRNRTLSATAWYEMARMYRELAEAKVAVAGRFGWMAERALEFEINVPVSTIRTDYHLLPLGAERLRSDLDQLSVVLADFRERYRDIPNVIQREFRFSTDFPQQFRALTSQAPAAPAEDIGHGVRAVEFHTTMADYDSRLPGRYAFGRVLGVEVELQTDIPPGVITGHIENAREVTTTVNGRTQVVQVSESLVRVPIPTLVEDRPFCQPHEALDDSLFSSSLIKEIDVPVAIDDFVAIEDTVVSVIDVAIAARPAESVAIAAREAEVEIDIDAAPVAMLALASTGAAGGDRHIERPAPRVAARLLSRPSRRSPIVGRARAYRAAFEPLVAYMLEPHRRSPVVRSPPRKAWPTAAEALAVRAARASITPAELAYAADSLSRMNDRESPDVGRARQEAQFGRWAERFGERGFQIEAGDLAAVLALQDEPGAFADIRLRDELNALMLSAPGTRTWERYELTGELPPAVLVSRDVSTGHGALRQRPLDILPDYLRYPAGRQAYGLRLKRHDADSQTISAYRVRENAVIFNPYNPGEQLGVFENTGIDSAWRLTLRALPGNPLNTTPQWDKIRDIVLRVWYHAAYERIEGFHLAKILEPQIIRWNADKLLALSLYRDFYDEFSRLLGDYDEHDPASLAAVRSFTDEAPALPGGWIRFTIDQTLIPAAGQRVAAMTVAFTAPEPSVFPTYVWRLRRGANGPVVQGTTTELPGPLTSRLSAAAPAGFGGLEVAGDWYFLLARADNPGLDLGPLRDIEILIELEPV